MTFLGRLALTCAIPLFILFFVMLFMWLEMQDDIHPVAFGRLVKTVLVLAGLEFVFMFMAIWGVR